MLRRRIVIEGIVQGVGFRPFVFQTATRLGVCGWVRNDSRGVTIEAEASTSVLAAFMHSLRHEFPPLAVISRMEETALPLAGDSGFMIRSSDASLAKTAQISPDTFVCPDCLGELFDPDDRRYRYPFINCTNCGPRYSIVTAVPYDRPLTTMVDFPLCPACLTEYQDPASRRFHAQPNACPVCGPRLSLQDAQGRPLATDDAVATTVALLRQGSIVAVKGLGGYHLAVDATNHGAVQELRRRKFRDEKPFALMSYGREQVLTYAAPSPLELRLLEGVERPIVLLQGQGEHDISPAVAPGNRYFGVMLPYTPLHYLLLRDNFVALVMTSGNQSDEPIVFEDDQAPGHLGAIADYLLGHDRRIHMRIDDSIARVMAGKPLLLRRSRGFVPRSLALPWVQPPVLALGAELKSTICITRGDRAFLSQHIGDLKNPDVFASFEQSILHLQRILEVEPALVAHDLHPDYYSSRFASNHGAIPCVAVQHHHAHLASCLVENGRNEQTIGVIFDGIGYGLDDRSWGGEFLVGDLVSFERAGHFAYVAMPGGDAATREPFRMGLSLLHHTFGATLPLELFSGRVTPRELKVLLQMLDKGINSPLTSSCGRLFDAVAGLAGIRSRVSFEGQAALELEMAIDREELGRYPFAIHALEGRLLVDPAPMIRALVADLRKGLPVGVVSARFHNGLAQVTFEVCRQLREQTGLGVVALSGGVFQNRFLAEAVIALLSTADFQVLTHSLVPPNDGGIALGQVAVAGGRIAAG